MGLGMAAVLWSLHNAGFFAMDDVVIAMGLSYGALAQVAAGIMAFRRNDTLGTTVFVGMGLFWASLVYTVLAPRASSLSVGTDPDFVGWYYLVLAVFAAVALAGALRRNRVFQLVFALLAVTFLLLACGKWFENDTLERTAGYVGLGCGGAAVYLAVAELVNDGLGRTVLPLGEGGRRKRRRLSLSDMPPLEPTVPHPFEDDLPEFED